MKDNGKYKFQDTEKGNIITFEKGCMVDAEVLFNEIFGSAFLQNKHVFLDRGKSTDFQSNSILKISRKITVEIKSITRNQKNLKNL